LIPDTHPLSVGVCGTYSRACANQSVDAADLVFFIGSKTGGQVTTNWQVPKRGTRVIQLDIDAGELGRNYPNAASLCGDAKATLARVIGAVKAPRKNAGWVKQVQGFVAAWRADADTMRNSDALPMRPERLGREITEALPNDAVVVSDTGHSGIWTATMIDLKHQTQKYIRCAGSMGWGFPGALGVKCAVGDRPVVCWTGDGAFYYHIAELETAARYGINLVIVVNDNSALNQEIPLVKNSMGRQNPAKPEELWLFEKTDFVKVAESFGCAGIRAETPQQLKDALAKAFSMNRPVVIDAISDINAFAKRAWLPQGASSGH
jgi:acetolactate synthase-1/2/3 large subunit